MIIIICVEKSERKKENQEIENISFFTRIKTKFSTSDNIGTKKKKKKKKKTDEQRGGG